MIAFIYRFAQSPTPYFIDTINRIMLQAYRIVAKNKRRANTQYYRHISRRDIDSKYYW